MSVILDEHNKRPQSLNARQTVEKICNFLLPFLLLLVYIAASAAIYYSVEKNCDLTFTCPASYLLLRDDDNDQQEDGTKAGNSDSSPIPTTRESTTSKPNDTFFTNETKLDSWENLTYWTAFHFIAVSVTTIGYGDVYPCTVAGQILIIVFSIIGIPITLIALTRMGKLFGFVFHKFWVKIYCCYKSPPYSDQQNKLFRNKYYIPFSVGIAITVMWILLASIYFHFTLMPMYEGRRTFTYFTALYFTVISFLTIGYGDISPVRYNLILATYLFLLIGLSLVTMCIDLMQIQFELMFQEMVEMIEEEYVNQIDDDEKTMSNDKRTAVNGLLQAKKQNSNFTTKLFMPFMGKSNHKKLANIYESKSKLISIDIQATKEMNSEEIQADIPGYFDDKFVDFIETTPTDAKRDFQCQVEFKSLKQISKEAVQMDKSTTSWKKKQDREFYQKVTEINIVQNEFL